MTLTRPWPDEAAKSRLPSVSPRPTASTIHERPAAEAHRRRGARRTVDATIANARDAEDRATPTTGRPRRRRASAGSRSRTRSRRARASPTPAASRRSPPSWCSCEASATPTIAHAIAGELGRRGPVAGGDPEDDRHDRRRAGDRRDDAHRPGRHAAVVGVQPERAGERRRDREQAPRSSLGGSPRGGDHDRDRDHARRAAPTAARAASRASGPATGRRSRRRPRRGSRRARGRRSSRGHSTGRVAAIASSWFAW